jgi:hypothetical protein
MARALFWLFAFHRDPDSGQTQNKQTNKKDEILLTVF